MPLVCGPLVSLTLFHFTSEEKNVLSGKDLEANGKMFREQEESPERSSVLAVFKKVTTLFLSLTRVKENVCCATFSDQRRFSCLVYAAQIWLMALCVTCVFAVTLSVFPAVTVRVQTIYKNQSWGESQSWCSPASNPTSLFSKPCSVSRR